MEQANYQEILDFLKQQPVIDTHEHIQPQEEVRANGIGIFTVFKNSYARLDFTSAGMPPEAWGLENEDEIWDVFSQYQDKVMQTEYFHNIIIALKELFDLKEDRITADNYKALSLKVKNAYDDKDWYHKVLQGKGKIEWGLLDTFWSIENFTFDKELFKPVFRIDVFIKGKGFVSPYEKTSIHSTLEYIADTWGVELETFDDHLAILGEGFRRFQTVSVSAIKIAIAYHRAIYFKNVSREEAEESFNSDGDKTAYQDYITHKSIQMATELGLPVQIHTGITARNFTTLNYTDPTLLNNLFIEYPNTKFVLFHFSYPFVDQALALTKTFPNVYIDLCWVPVISSQMAISSLEKALDLIPYNKIMWGGDAYRVEEAYGTLITGQDVVSRVLDNRINRGRLNLVDAKKIAKAIFYDNAKELYRLT